MAQYIITMIRVREKTSLQLNCNANSARVTRQQIKWSCMNLRHAISS